MRFDYSGKTYDFDDSRILLSEFRYIKRQTARPLENYPGMGSTEFITGVMQMEGEALAAAVLLSAKRAGEALHWEDLQDLDVIELINSIADYRRADKLAAEAAAEDAEPPPAAADEPEPEPQPEPKPQARPRRAKPAA